MSKKIKQVDENYIAIIETTVDERLVAKVTLTARRTALLAEIAEIDNTLLLFVDPK